MSNVMSQSKFLELIKRSGLVDEDKLEKFLTKANEEHGSAIAEDQKRLADLMIEAGLLTRWQADKLLAGKHKGFKLGKYKLLDQIGRGGMSSVYLAEHTLMRRPVAIKVLPRNRVEDPAYLERFRLEARAVAKLDDPNIVRAYDIDNEGDAHFIVMEYVDGDDLHRTVSKIGPLPYELAADYIAQAANGLQHAHEQGLVHRDIKPANFLVDRHQTVKLLDLGLAKLVEDDLTSLTLANDENVLGTADYLAPEQALNSHAADSRADVYSLGCTLYFLLTGRPPFPEGSISERLLKHQTAKPESIFKIRPDAPPTLVEICERMMSKNPADRYQTAQEIADILTGWLAERGRSLGGGELQDRGDSDRLGGSGVGSDVLSRYSMPSPTPIPGRAPSSETLSASDRDTAKLVDEPSGISALDEDISLAPLEEEESVISSFDVKRSQTKLAAEAQAEETAKSKKSASSKSLIEEEFHDPDAEQIARRVAQRAQYNPLHPPGYTAPRQSPPWGLLAAILGGVLLVAIIVVAVVMGL